MSRNRCGWSARSEDYLEEVKVVLQEMRSYWPLTLRQVYYQLVAKLAIENIPAQYRKLSRILAKARIDGLVSWACLEDRARQMNVVSSWPDKSAFLKTVQTWIRYHYSRDLLSTQHHRIEVWVEKDALSALVKRALGSYAIPVVVARGFSSVSFLHDCAERVKRRLRDEKKHTRILYFGDLDPSGWEMLPAMTTTLVDEMLGMQWMAVSFKRCALLPSHVEKHQLPVNPDAMKEGDSRTKKYRKMLQGMRLDDNLSVELDALKPADFIDLVRAEVEAELDHELVEEQRRIQETEKENLELIAQKLNE